MEHQGHKGLELLTYTTLMNEAKLSSVLFKPLLVGWFGLVVTLL